MAKSVKPKPPSEDEVYKDLLSSSLAYFGIGLDKHGEYLAYMSHKNNQFSAYNALVDFWSNQKRSPTTIELCKILGWSEDSVRRALSHLCRKKRVLRIGIGRYIPVIEHENNAKN